ncbi:MAG: universal stress protein, partial [Pyrinomonadaceae bacterium]|nr:universal stress protein [Pyrinomonadaceae bacterium]
MTFMKILIAYDGSDCADAAIEDLSRAGLPNACEALILNVTETWLPKDLENESFGDTLGFAGSETFKQMRAAAREKIAEGEKLAASASLLVRQKFPAWQVRHKSTGGFAEWGIVEEAKEYQPDLVVVGSHGRGGVKRFFLGSVSLKVLSEAACSVRVARGSNARAADDDSPPRVVVAIDGSPDSWNAVETALRRDWLPETSVRLISAVEPLPFSVLLAELPRAEEVREKAATLLKEKGLHVSTVVEFGRAKSV